VRRRDRGSAVRLQINAAPEEPVSQFLARALNLPDPDVYPQGRPLAISTLLGELSSRPELKQLQDEPFTPSVPATLGDASVNLFDAVRTATCSCHHPYESFEPVVSFIDSAADDPDVLAIKMTLYRAGQGSPIVRALQRAAENGKQVTALVELKARMDEEANILWARQLEAIRRARRLRPDRFQDARQSSPWWSGGGQEHPALRAPGYRELQQRHCAQLFGPVALHRARRLRRRRAPRSSNLLTGYSKPSQLAEIPRLTPGPQAGGVLQLIDDEARSGSDGRIVAKMNALADPEVIKALYRASQAGVQIDLLVRGTCCLRPGVPKLSERIRVTSTVDRFLEHARIWHFPRAREKKVYLASGDWMPRNFIRRVDVGLPVDSPALKERILSRSSGR